MAGRNFLRCGAMKKILSVVAAGLAAAAVTAATDQTRKAKIDSAQIPKWSADDLDFFLHGSMSTEVVPERVLRAFIKIYPDLFPASDLAYLGLIPDPAFGWPIGMAEKPRSNILAVCRLSGSTAPHVTWPRSIRAGKSRSASWERPVISTWKRSSVPFWSRLLKPQSQET
jgi:hypothetical protein